MLQGSLVCLASPAYTILLYCNTIHKLGILLLLDLRWETHIDYIISKAVSSLYFLKQLKRAGLPSSHLSHFYITVIRPILEYASPLWHPTLTKSQAERLEAVQRRAINIIFGYSSPTPYFAILAMAGIPSLQARRLDLSKRFFRKICQPERQT